MTDIIFVSEIATCECIQCYICSRKDHRTQKSTSGPTAEAEEGKHMGQSSFKPRMCPLILI